MNISKVCVNLTGDDILSIINDFLKIEGLKINEAIIHNGVELKGSFTKGIKIEFSILIDNLNIINGKVVGKLSKLKVYKLGVFRIFRSLALKKLIKVIGDIGIYTTKDKITVDIDRVLKIVPFLKIDAKNINIVNNIVSVEVENINLDLTGKVTEAESEKAERSVEEQIYGNNINKDAICEQVAEEQILEEEEVILKDTKKADDFYTVSRDTTKEKLEEKLPKNAKAYSDYLFLIPDLLALVCRLLKDSRVPMKTKIAVSGSIAYIICPTDMIPSNIPFVGKIDDLAVLFFALNRIAKEVPFNVLVENWSGKNELILVLKNGVEYVSGFTGAGNIDRIYNVAEELATL